MRAGEGSCHVTSLAAARCTCSRGQSGREGWRSSSERQVQGHLAEEALEQTVRLDGFALMVESSATRSGSRFPLAKFGSKMRTKRATSYSWTRLYGFWQNFPPQAILEVLKSATYAVNRCQIVGGDL